MSYKLCPLCGVPILKKGQKRKHPDDYRHARGCPKERKRSMIEPGRGICPVFDCAARIDMRRLCCPKHWRMLSKPKQQQVLRAFDLWCRGGNANAAALRVVQFEAIEEIELTERNKVV